MQKNKIVKSVDKILEAKEAETKEFKPYVTHSNVIDINNVAVKIIEETREVKIYTIYLNGKIIMENPNKDVAMMEYNKLTKSNS